MIPPDCGCNATPYAPVAPQVTCSGDPWLGWEVQIHDNRTTAKSYLDEGATSTTIRSAGADLYLALAFTVEDEAVATPFDIGIYSHTAITGAGEITLDRISIDLDDLASGTHYFTISALIPKGTFYSLRVNEKDLLATFTYFQSGAIV